jgi:uncharacterized membrane protein YqjE
MRSRDSSGRRSQVASITFAVDDREETGVRVPTESLGLGLGLVLIGLVLMLVSGLADVIGLGDPTARFGWKQVLGLLVGVALVVAGAIIAWTTRRGRKGPTAPQ